MTHESWSIDELAEISGLSVRTIRYYQTEGLLPPPALEGRYAVYSSTHLKRLGEIKKAKEQRNRAGLYAERTAAMGCPSPILQAQRGDRIEEVLRCVVGEGIEVFISAERAGLSREGVQTMLSEIAIIVQRRTQDEPTELTLRERALPEGTQEGSATMAPSLADASPKETLRMLEQLKDLGLTDDQFRRLHPKLGETIQRHMTYVGGRDVFRAGSMNVLVNHRLQLCLAFLRDQAGPELSGVTRQLMDRCVADAARAIPIV